MRADRELDGSRQIRNGRYFALTVMSDSRDNGSRMRSDFTSSTAPRKTVECHHDISIFGQRHRKLRVNDLPMQ